MRTLLTTAALLALSASVDRPLAAQADSLAERKAVLAVVDRLFTAMARRDSAGFREVFAPGATLVGMRRRAAGDSVMQSLTWERFMTMNTADRRGTWIERAWNPEVRIRGTLATVWAEYDFHFGMTPSHCGVDAVQLLKMNGAWKIVSIADTYEPAGCPRRPPPQDTTFIDVGGKPFELRFQPHAARVRVYRGDSLTAEWTNELTLGDSAGRQVMHWVTTSHPVPSSPQRALSVLRQTYDALTLAPLGYWSIANNGAETRVTFEGPAVRGYRRVPGDTTRIAVRHDLPRPAFMAGASDLVPIAAGLHEGQVLVAPVWGLGMAVPIERVFTVIGDTVVTVEGTPTRSVKVEERNRSDRKLYASWYLLRESPYMVYGEVPLPDGRIQRMTEVAVPMSRK